MIKEVVKEVVKKVPTENKTVQTLINMENFEQERTLVKAESRGKQGSGTNSKAKLSEGSQRPPR